MSIHIAGNIHRNNSFRALYIEPEADKHIQQELPVEERKNLLNIGNRMKNYTHYDMIIGEDMFGQLSCNVKAKNKDWYGSVLKQNDNNSLFVTYFPYKKLDHRNKQLEHLNQTEAIRFYENQKNVSYNFEKAAITVDALELDATREDKIINNEQIRKAKIASDNSYINKLTNKFGTKKQKN